MAKERKKKRPKWEDEEDRWRHEDLKPETRQSIWAVVSFAAAAVLFLAWYGKAGLAGNGIYSLTDLLFGRAFLVMPLAFMFAGVSFLFGMRQRIWGGTLFGALIFLISVLGVSELIGGPQTSGYIGFAIAYLPLRFFDTMVSGILFGALLIISFLLMFNRALIPRWGPELPVEEEGEEELKEQEEKRGFLGSLFALFKQKNAAPLNEPLSEEALMPTEEPVEDEPAEGNAGVFEEGEEQEERKEPVLSVIAQRHVASAYQPPSLNLLEQDRGKPSSGDVRANANIIQRTLQNFGIDVDMGEVNVGPSVTQYTLKPAEGVKLQRITNLSSNLGLALAAHPLRIEAPIPGRSLVGIEVPNKSIAFVGLRNLITEFIKYRSEYALGFALGRDVTGKAAFADLARMPHLLVAGSTGSGKSVTIHSLLLGLLFFNPPERLRLVLIDPKRVELPFYDDIPHLITPVIVDAKKAIQALRWVVKEMEQRYIKLQEAKARDIISYNNDEDNEELMPYIIVVIDELADLMSAYPREVEASIVRLAQMARAVGIHLVVSTQRPSVDVITGLIKANITTRIALRVISQTDSRTIIDMGGADKLLGKGDMLYLSGDAAKPKRVQGVYVSEEEVKRVTKYLRGQKGEFGEEFLAENIFASQGGGEILGDEHADADDELYEEARQIVIESKKASTSYLQRRLRLGYARAARLIDMLEDRGVVGPADGAKPRDILIHKDAEEKLDEIREL